LNRTANWPGPSFRMRCVKAPRAKNIRVALIGAIGRHKGYDVLLACARDATAKA